MKGTDLERLDEGQANERRILKQMDDLLERREQNLAAEFEATLSELAKPRKNQSIPVTPEGDDVPDLNPAVRADAERRPVGQVQTRVGESPLYSRLSEEERQWRTPEGDHWLRNWFQALAQNDGGAVQRAYDEIERVFGRTWAVGDVYGGTPPPAYDGTAGAMVPLPLVNLIMINRDRVSKIPMMSTQIALTAMSNRIPRMDQVTVGMHSEGNVPSASEPTVDELNMTARKMMAHAEISVETLADSAFNTVALLTSRVGMAFGQLEDIQATAVGARGANDITQSIAQAFPPADQGGVAALDFATVVGVYFGVGQPYRADGIWIGNSAGLQILTSVANSDGYPIFSTQAAVPGAIVDDSADGFVFRRPVYEVPLGGATGACIGFYSASAYGWGRRAGMSVAVTNSVRWLQDEISYKFTQRVDGLMLDSGDGAGNPNATASLIDNFT